MSLTNDHLQELVKAVLLLENPGIAAKITNLFGKPIEKGLELLPKKWNEKIGEVTKTALLKATDAAIFTMRDTPKSESSNWWHKTGVAASGAVGGFFGLAAIALELPITTTIMLRSIADIARSEGESLNHPRTKIACLEVLALGGENKSDDSSESGYFIIRSMLAKSVTEAAEFIAKKTLIEEGAPPLIKLIVKIAERLTIQITEKVVAQSIPIIGAVGGATINTIFINHFQDMAKGHFIVRKLEKIYGKEFIESEYKKILVKEMT